MNGKVLPGVFAGALAVTSFLAFAPSAMADGEWKAPDVTVFLGPDVVDDGQTDKGGPMLNETIINYWSEGECTYDTVTGQPSSSCDRLRFGLAMYRGTDEDFTNNPGYCPSSFSALVTPQEDGGGELTLDGKPYKVSQLQSDSGTAYCSDPNQRTHGSSLLDYRDFRFGDELGTSWPDRPQLTLHLVEKLPQSDANAEDEVRDSLLAACELFEGNGGQHLSLPSWVILSPLANAQGKLYGELLAAAGGTGQCCYKPDHGGSCDPTDPAQILDFCDHLRQKTVSLLPVHTESKIRSDITNQQYQCTGTGKPAGPGAMNTSKFSDMKCHLQGSPCDGGNAPDAPAYLWPVLSCIQLRPPNVPVDQLSVEYCGSINGDPIDATDGDKDGDGCITLTPGNGIEFVDEDKNLFYVSNGDQAMCKSIGNGEGWTETNCTNLNELCELDDGSQCSLGRVQCVNHVEECHRFPGNDSCDSGACGDETVHETGVLPPNAQFVVDRSGSMPIDDRWGSAREVAKNLADWSYAGPGCEADGTNCDKVRLGVHFWSGMNPNDGTTEVTAVSAGEDTTSGDMQSAFDNNGPYGGTDFHHGARLLRDESALLDAGRANVGIFVTDGISENAYTTREAVRIMCDIRSRSTAPVATYVVGFADGEENLNSMMAAAGGTGSCCFSEDGTCDSEREYSPCEMYRYEQNNGQQIVDTFETWLQTHRPSHYNEWIALDERIDSHMHTEDSYNTGTVADKLDLVDDVTRWLLKQDEGWDPQHLNCETDAGDANSSNAIEFYKYVLCETKKTLSYTVRHLYEGNISENNSSWWDFNNVYTDNHDSAFVTHDYTCTGSKFANDQNALQEELQAILEGIECTYPLSLLADMDSAPEYTDATHVKLYMPELGAVVEVPHMDDSAGRSAFASELESLGIANASSYEDDGWSFANEGRTAVQLSGELCDLTKTDNVAKVTTQVCRMCDPSLVGTPCAYVACQPDPATIDGDFAYTTDGQLCEWTEYPCPENPEQTCSGWAKTGRCGMGGYACDEDGFPYCEQIHSRMPEICNGVDDDCDGTIDDLRENQQEWAEPEYDISGTEYDGWYCSYHDTCTCPGQTPDSIGGTKADGSLEFQKMLEHQAANGDCVCGEGIAEEGMPAYEPTRTYAPTAPKAEPQASCSSSADNAPLGVGAALTALLFGLFGWRRRRS